VPGASVVIPPGALDGVRSISFTVGPATPDTLAVLLESHTGEATLSAPATVTINLAECSTSPHGPDGSGLLLNETTSTFPDSATAESGDDTPPSGQEVVLSVQSFSWYIIAH
jgi:hypothetical protein